MSENRLDKAIGDVAYVLDSLIAMRNIHDTGCCNDCECSKGCTYKPEWGKPVRYNCPFYVRKEVEGRMSELKPCPFCGDTHIKIYRSRAGYQVGCNTVNCIAYHGPVRAYLTEKEAAEAWNRRASDE